jgi:hypothetical protein
MSMPTHSVLASINESLKVLNIQITMKIKSILRGYVPRPVLIAVEGGPQNQWVAELRVVNTLFIRVSGLKYESAASLDEVQGYYSAY